MLRAARVLLAALLVAVALTGCRQEFDATAGWLRSQPGVQSVEDRGYPGLLYLSYEGDVRAHIDPELSDADFDTLVAAASDYRAEHDDEDIGIQLARGEMVVQIDADRIASAGLVTVLRRYDGDPRITAAVVATEWQMLAAKREDVVDVDRAYRSGDWQDRLAVSDGFDDPTVSISRSSNVECDMGPVYDFVDEWLEDPDGMPDDAQLHVSICGAVNEEVSADEWVAEVFRAHDRFVDSGLTPDDIAIGVEVDGGAVEDRDARVSMLDPRPLELVRLVDTEDLDRTRILLGVDSLGRRFLALTEDDGTVCDLLDVVRGKPGYDALDRLYLRTDGADVSASRTEVEQVIDAAGRTPDGCGVAGEYHVE